MSAYRQVRDYTKNVLSNPKETCNLYSLHVYTLSRQASTVMLYAGGYTSSFSKLETRMGDVVGGKPEQQVGFLRRNSIFHGEEELAARSDCRTNK